MTDEAMARLCELAKYIECGSDHLVESEVAQTLVDAWNAGYEQGQEDCADAYSYDDGWRGE